MSAVNFSMLFRKKNDASLGSEIPHVPKIFWCRHYYHPGTTTPIPDGAACCFNHYIGLPDREQFGLDRKVRHPLYDYQEMILDAIEADLRRLYAIMKSPKLGMTEFWIRFALWKCLIDPVWEKGQVVIVNATRQSESNLIIKRMKELCDNPHHPIPYDRGQNTKSNFTVNKTEIFAFPAGNIDSIRSKENARFVLIDESAFFKMMESDSRVKDAAEHYFGSLNYYLVFISTAGELAKGFFYNIVKYPEQNKKYNVFEFTNPDKYGLPPHPESGTSMYSREMLEVHKLDPAYKRNYLGVWGAGSDTIFDHEILDYISSERYRIERPRSFNSVLGVDPAYGRGQSKVDARFALVGMYEKNGVIYTDFCGEHHQISESDGRVLIHRAMKRGYTTLCIDAAYPGLIKDLSKQYYVKPMNFAELQSGHKLEQVLGSDELKYEEGMKMIDVLERAVSEHKVRIHPDHGILLDQLRTIQRNERGLPNKKISRFDLGDCLEMGVYYLTRYKSVGFV